MTMIDLAPDPAPDAAPAALYRLSGVTRTYTQKGRVVKALAHSVVVMRHGKVVEAGPAAGIFARPRDPYMRQLMAAAFDIETTTDGLFPADQTD